MSFRGTDFRRYGPNIYLNVWDWYTDVDNPLAQTDCIGYIFGFSENEITDLFEHIYYPVKELVLNEETEEYEEVTNYYDCGIEYETILTEWIDLYGERKLFQPYYEDFRGTRRSLIKMANTIKTVIDLNKYKYKKLAATLGFTYDPISNYDMTEEGTDEVTPTGTETMTHNVQQNKINGVEVTGPVSAYSTTAGDNPTLTVTISTDKVVNTTQEAVSDVRQGERVNFPDASTVTGGTPTQNHYTTTMDSASTGRLESYDTTTGDTAQDLVSSTDTETPAQGRITAGSPNSPSYTDTKTFTNKKETKEHELTRKGNIGVTTSQQMIESERQIVRISLVKEFFDDIAKQLLLSVW